MVHIVIVVVDGGDDCLLGSLLDTLGDDPHPAELRDRAKKHQQDQHDGEDHWGALAGVAAKETVLAHFQYTSDFPVASDRSVMGNEPKPPNRPMSMSNVSVTVTSSLS